MLNQNPVFRVLNKRQRRATRWGFLREAFTRSWCWWILIPTFILGLVVVVSVIWLTGSIPSTEYKFAIRLCVVAIVVEILVALIPTVLEVRQIPHLMERLRNLRGRPYFCHKCGYDLRRSDGTTCPECGWAIYIQPKQPRERWRVIRGKCIVRWLRIISLLAFGLLAIWTLWFAFDGMRTW